MQHKELTLDTLTCTETADAQEDDCRIEVYLDPDDPANPRDNGDRREPYALRESMEADEAWDVDRSFWLGTEATVKLYVTDWLFPDEWPDSLEDIDFSIGAELGSEALDGSASGPITFESDEHGGEYELSYSWSQPSGTLKPVERALQAFPSNNKTGEWAWVDADDLKQRVKTIVNFAMSGTDPGDAGPSISGSPHWINQDGTPFCGPAGIAYSLAAREPRLFVETVRSLYEQGAFHGAEEVGIVSKALRRSSVPKSIRREDFWAEWVLLSGIRESAHWFDVANNAFISGGASAVHMNLPWTMAHWAKDVLGHSEVAWFSNSLFLEAVHTLVGNPGVDPTKESSAVDAVKEAYNFHTKDGFASVLVDPTFPDGDVGFNFPQHWVALGGNFDHDESSSEVTIDFHNSAPYPSDRRGDYNITIDEGDFETYVWGVVCGQS
jgi:hypothetical protein